MYTFLHLPNNQSLTHLCVDEDEIAQLKKQNAELRYQNTQVLNHLQDGRQLHVESEVQSLISVIPQRNISLVYKCKPENDELRQCYTSTLANGKNATEDSMISLDILKCRSLVTKFVECAQTTRRDFLANQDL